MSAADQWDAGPGPGPAYAGPRSQAVTAVAIANFAVAALQVIMALVLMFATAWIFGAAVDAAKVEIKGAGVDVKVQKQAVEQATAAAGGILAGMAIFLGVCTLIVSGLFVLAGLGVLNRKQYGRIISLILGVLMGLGALGGLLQLGSAPALALFNIIIGGGYCVLVFVVLLNSRYAAEFR
jgi:hypothetical protein